MIEGCRNNHILGCHSNMSIINKFLDVGDSKTKSEHASSSPSVGKAAKGRAWRYKVGQFLFAPVHCWAVKGDLNKHSLTFFRGVKVRLKKEVCSCLVICTRSTTLLSLFVTLQGLDVSKNHVEFMPMSSFFLNGCLRCNITSTSLNFFKLKEIWWSC